MDLPDSEFRVWSKCMTTMTAPETEMPSRAHAKANGDEEDQEEERQQQEAEEEMEKSEGRMSRRRGSSPPSGAIFSWLGTNDRSHFHDGELPTARIQKQKDDHGMKLSIMVCNTWKAAPRGEFGTIVAK